MFTLDPHRYGPPVAALLSAAPLNELGPGTSQEKAHAALQNLTPESLAAGGTLHDRQMALACLAALWLRCDFLDQSHQISQGLDTREGDYWHGILHRREPDYGNARYWMRRVGQHTIHGRLLAGSRQLAAESRQPAADFLRTQVEWDAGRFVTLCEEALDDSPPLHTLVKKIQRLEWELLFDHCHRLAMGIPLEV